jgi:hypothetical protein
MIAPQLGIPSIYDQLQIKISKIIVEQLSASPP